jgi:cytochrome c
MDSFDFNKIAGAVLGLLLFVMATGIVAEAIFAPPKQVVAGYALPGASAETAAPAAGEAKAVAEPIAVRLAKADPAKGQANVKACAACHNFEKGAANKVGPVLWNVVERAKGSVEGFNYSAALKERASKGEKWTYENLDSFIENPKVYLAGTAMGFAGLGDPQKRAEIIAYLHSLSDSPVPLPK